MERTTTTENAAAQRSSSRHSALPSALKVAAAAAALSLFMAACGGGSGDIIIALPLLGTPSQSKPAQTVDRDIMEYVLDEKGKPVLDANGKPQKKPVEKEKGLKFDSPINSSGGIGTEKKFVVQDTSTTDPDKNRLTKAVKDQSVRGVVYGEEGQITAELKPTGSARGQTQTGTPVRAVAAARLVQAGAARQAVSAVSLESDSSPVTIRLTPQADGSMHIGVTVKAGKEKEWRYVTLTFAGNPKIRLRIDNEIPEAKKQTLTFGTAPGPLTAGGATGTLTATSTNAGGKPIVYASTTTSICTVAGNVVTPLAAGTCTITANQAGGEKDGVTYSAADQVTETITVNAKAELQSQAIEFDNAVSPSKPFAVQAITLGATFTDKASASSKLPVSYAAQGKCKVDSKTGAITATDGAGDCTITVSQAGNEKFKAAKSIDRSYKILDVCTPLAPTAGDSIHSTITAKSADFNWPKSVNGPNPPENPVLDELPSSTVTYSYAAGKHNGNNSIALSTRTAGAGKRSDNGKLSKAPAGTAKTAWAGWVPQPAGSFSEAGVQMTGAAQTYHFNAAGEVLHAPVMPGKNDCTIMTYGLAGSNASKARKQGTCSGAGWQEKYSAVHQFFPYDWQRQLARQVTANTADGADLTKTIALTWRTTGGALAAMQYAKANAGLFGGPYKEVYFNATAKLVSKNPTTIDGVQYNSCQFEFTLTPLPAKGGLREKGWGEDDKPGVRNVRVRVPSDPSGVIFGNDPATAGAGAEGGIWSGSFTTSNQAPRSLTSILEMTNAHGNEENCAGSKGKKMACAAIGTKIEESVSKLKLKTR